MDAEDFQKEQHRQTVRENDIDDDIAFPRNETNKESSLPKEKGEKKMAKGLSFLQVRSFVTTAQNSKKNKFFLSFLQTGSFSNRTIDYFSLNGTQQRAISSSLPSVSNIITDSASRFEGSSSLV